jgi:tetratricopeptide (TPR) repeat protein
MQGFSLPAPEYEFWLQSQRQHFQSLRLNSLLSRAKQELNPAAGILTDATEIIPACLHAAQTDFHNGQYDSALRFLDHAWRLSDDPASRFTILLQRGDTLLESDSPLQAISSYEQAAKLAQQPQQQAQASIGMARGLLARKQYTAANQLLDRILPQLIDTEHNAALAQLHYCRGTITHRQARRDQTLIEYRTAVKFAELARDPLWMCRTNHALASSALHFLQFQTALMHSERSLRHAQAVNLDQFEIPNLILRGLAQLSLNRLHDSFLELEYALSLAKRNDDTAYLCQIQLHLAELALWQERYATALAYCDNALSIAPDGATKTRLAALAVLAEHLLHGVADDDDRIDRAYVQSLDHDDPACSALILAMLTRVSADPLRCRWAWEESERLLSELPESIDHLCCYVHIIEATLTQSRWKFARYYATRLGTALPDDAAPFFHMFVQRANLLADIGEGHDHQRALGRLKKLREQAYELNLLALLPEYEKAHQLINRVPDNLLQ